jgi:hypothetical protein
MVRFWSCIRRFACFSQRSVGNTHDPPCRPVKSHSQLVAKPAAHPRGPSARLSSSHSIEQPKPSFAPHPPIDCLDRVHDDNLMPKRKNQDTTDGMSAPPKKTRATKSKKVAEDGKYISFSIPKRRVRTYRDARRRGECVTPLSLPSIHRRESSSLQRCAKLRRAFTSFFPSHLVPPHLTPSSSQSRHCPPRT